MSAAALAPTATTSAPLPMASSGSMPAASHTARVSSRTGMASALTSRPRPEASAISHRPVTTPPSVTSCRAWAPATRATRAASTTLMPGSARKSRARASTAASRRPAKASPFSRATKAVASMAAPPVRMAASPGRAPALESGSRPSRSPSIVPQTIGRSRPAVHSVCPPTRRTSSRRQASAKSAKTASTASGSASTGRRSVAMKNRGRAPHTATSFALTVTA